eukprot:TRINITY_DN3227_c0_g1_i1.p1 TRINITY_DN3227_c0_g1~~TRINITY_DN3227_c0_g1_i1.p1  ORF type:complete len:364 (-),score=83.63 TRINITY_DN3227_c0_g1_i1:63-1082(-)
MEVPERKFVTIKDLRKKKTKELGVISTSQQLVSSLDKTAKKAYYLGAVSVVLLRILNSRSNKIKRDIKAHLQRDLEEDIISYLSKVVEDWRDYLSWLEDGLSLFSLVMKSQQIELIITERQVETIINATKTLQIIMKSIQSVITFVVLTKVVLKKATGYAFGKYKTLIWLSSLAFLYSQMRDVWPQLLMQTGPIWTVVSTIMTMFKGPLRALCMDLLADFQETSPEFFEKMQEKLENIQMMASVPRIMLQKGTQFLQLAVKKQLKPIMYEYLLPPLQNILLKSYQTYLLSKESLTGLSVADVMTILSQFEWSQELLRSVQKYLFWAKSTKLSLEPRSKL